MNEILNMVGELLKAWTKNLELQNKKLTLELESNEAEKKPISIAPSAHLWETITITEETEKPAQPKVEEEPAEEKAATEDLQEMVPNDVWGVPATGDGNLDKKLNSWLRYSAKVGKIPHRLFKGRYSNGVQRFLYRKADIEGLQNGTRKISDIFEEGLRKIGLYSINGAAELVHPLGNCNTDDKRCTGKVLNRGIIDGLLPSIWLDGRHYLNIYSLRRFAADFSLHYKEKNKLEKIALTNVDWCICPLEYLGWLVFRRYEILTEGMNATETQLIVDAVADCGALTHKINGALCVDVRDVEKIYKNMQPTEEK